MALIDKASLLMVPSTYEDGTLYNVLPSGNKAPDETGNHNGYDQTRADFTFSRGSNLAATRRNSSGLIEKGRENLLTYSNELDNSAWQGTDVTSGQSGYDGGSNAFLVGGAIRQNLSYSGIVTFSAYIKAGTATECLLRMDAGTDARIFVDLSDGTLIYEDSSVIAYTIEPVSGAEGWYRISLSANITSGANVRIVATESNQAVTDNILIQSAQLEKGLVATDYIETGSSTAQAGILEDMPRINYDANGENGALLLEPSRTNNHTHSNYFGASYYIKDSGVSITTNDATSPEGVQNASKVSVSSNGRIYANHTSGTYTTSVFIKAGTFSHFRFIGQNVDLTTSPISVGSLDFDDYGNGWYRIYGSYTGNRGFQIQAYPDNTYSSHTDNGDYYIYGAQLEAGSYMSSLIPTHGAAVTRGADVCNNGTLATDLIGQQSGVIYAEFKAPTAGTSSNWFNLSRADSTADWIFIGKDNDKVRGYVRVGGSIIWSDSTNVLSSGYQKVALRYKSGDIALFINGVKEETSSATYTISNTLSRVSFGTPYGGALEVIEHKEAMVFDTALTDAECVTLTTL